MHDDWLLDPDIRFLNHGSFGACPRPVLEAQQRYRERMERDPVQWMIVHLEPLMDAARSELAALVGHEVPGQVAKAGRRCDLHLPPVDVRESLMRSE